MTAPDSRLRSVLGRKRTTGGVLMHHLHHLHHFFVKSRVEACIGKLPNYWCNYCNYCRDWPRLGTVGAAKCEIVKKATGHDWPYMVSGQPGSDLLTPAAISTSRGDDDIPSICA